MTGEEAIKILETGSIMPDYPHTVEMLNEALRMGAAALRAQQARAQQARAQQARAKLDRSRWEGCKLCNEPMLVGFTTYCGYQYCKNCGRPLTEEAWAALERRIST